VEHLCARGQPACVAVQSIIGGLAAVIMPGLMLVGVVLARRNVKAGRGDRPGAFRAAAFIFGVSLMSWILGATHVPSFGIEIERLFAAVGRALFDAGLLWLTYLGLEPYIRRYSPDSLLGWTRVLAGKWRDPRAGVDLLVGVSAGLLMTVLYALHNVLPMTMGQPEPMPLSDPQVLMGLRQVLSSIAFSITNAVTSGMLGVVGVVGLTLALRRAWVARPAAIVFFTPVALSGMFPGSRTPILDLAIAAGTITIFLIVIAWAGLLSTIAALFTHFVLLRAPITTDFSSWRAPIGFWYLGVIAVAGLGACYIARKGQSDRPVTTS
jgi:hypothetical protein